MRPELAERLRVIETLGPSAIPPLVVSRAVPRARRESLLGLLLEMHGDAAGAEILARAEVARFVRASLTAYDEIRRMAQLAQAARF